MELSNQIELLGYYGGDETHALSAWTSTSRDLDEEKKGRMGKLLTMLAENGHHTPFEKSFLHFLVDVETASHIHLLKHRIGVSINAESARYKEHKEDKYYLPVDWSEYERERLQSFTEHAFSEYHSCIERLVEEGKSRKRAKESARFYLPYNSQIYMDVGFNFRSFMHFQGLRNDEHAQLEIRQIAGMMLELVRETGEFDLSLSAFGY